MKQLLMDCVLPFIPEEITTEILKQLPVKSLIRFRSVCKQWKNLVKIPSFIQDHLNNSTRRNPSLLMKHMKHLDGYNSISLCLVDCEMQCLEVIKNPTLLNSLNYTFIVGSSNGLILLCINAAISAYLLLWNPATREVRQLPNSSENFWGTSRFGFGFSPFINDYKIVKVSFCLRPVRRIQVFSLSTGRWRNIQVDNIKDVDFRGDGVTLNGVMFWKGTRQGFDKRYDSNDVIVSFDMASEVFTPWPISLHVPNVNFTLAVYEDKLAIISDPKINDSFIYFGVMEEEVIGSSKKRWSLSRKYLYDFDPFNLFVGTIWRNQIVCIDSELARDITQLEGEKENDNDEAKFGLYLINVTTNKRKALFPIKKQFGNYVQLFNYVESLVPVGNTQIEEP